MNTPLYNALKQYFENNIRSFHMPGHKNGNYLPINELVNMDITEIEGLDNLHCPQGVINEAQIIAANIYNTYNTFFLINGSTVGILSAVLGITNKGDTILMARNCHKSVYNAVLLGELNPIYIYPQILSNYISGGINPEDVLDLIKNNKNIKALILTSPTYEGVVSDIKTIADIVHSFNIPLIVDEAHGAHLKFHSSFPSSAIDLGADVVIHSLHKTLPALTQTALLHINSNKFKINKIIEYLSILQTSSPSYILMASIDYCLGLVNEKREELFNKYITNIEWLRKEIKNNLINIELMDDDIIGKSSVYQLDKSKLVFNTNNCNINSNKIQQILRDKYKIQMEFAYEKYLLGITTISDKIDVYKYFTKAITEIDKNVIKSKKNTDNLSSKLIFSELIMKPCVAKNNDFIIIDLEKSIGSISYEFVIPYPPGIPILVPGERITEDLIELVNYYIKEGININGLEDKEIKKIKVIK